MWAFLQSLLDSSTLSPHGICLLWRPELIWIHVMSDTVIALSYFSIPIVLSIFVSKRSDVEFGWVFWAFAIFITACGATHVLSIWTLWFPDYAIEGGVKALTAAASLATAIMLWPLLPKVLALPSPTQLREAYAALNNQIVERVKAEDMLRQSQKMDAVGQLTGGVAHDFNNLLTVIIGNLEIAQHSLDTFAAGAEERLRRLLGTAMSGAQRAAALTQRLLAFSRRQPLNPKPVDVNKLIPGLSDFFHRTLGVNIKLEMVSGAGLWQVEADPAELESAILNLVVNARDAMPKGGKLTIETGNAYLDDDYCRRNHEVAPGQYVQIAVTDTGTGMSRDVLERAFEPFFTTKTPGAGTGLGLSQVYGFIRQSGGHLKMDSAVGAGTTVNIYLPRLMIAVDQAEPAPPDLVGGSPGESLLVVEDDPDVRVYVVEVLRGLGYRVLEARDADSALQLIEQPGAQVDLLLTDVILPGRNGRQLADAMKKRQPGLKVLFMTGYSHDAIAHQGRLDPGVDLIQKPLTQLTLAARIRSLLDAG